MKVEIVQDTPKLSRDNFQWHIDAIKESEADLLLFPELSMNGYKIKDSILEDSFEIDELDIFRELSLKRDICLGVALKDNFRIFNSAIYFSDGDYKVYNKRILPNYGMFEEERFFFKGEEYFSFDTKFGKTAIFICEDMFSGNTLKFIANEKPDLIIVLSASPAREFNDNGLLIEDNWNSILKTSAILSGAYVLFANRVGFEDGLGFWGGSKIITPKGEIEKRAKLFKRDKITSFLDKKLSLTTKYFLRKS